MRILHVLDHSVPLHSGYAFRTIAILKQQRALGWNTAHITSNKHTITQKLEETVDGYKFYPTPQHSSLAEKIPVLSQLVTITSLRQRLIDVVHNYKPDILHAHSPCLTGIAALLVGRKSSCI